MVVNIYKLIVHILRNYAYRFNDFLVSVHTLLAPWLKLRYSCHCGSDTNRYLSLASCN